MAKDFEKLLKDITTAADDCKRTTNDAHIARKDLLAVVKEARAELPRQLAEMLGPLLDDVRVQVTAEMQELMVGVVGRLEADWRLKLGLDP